MHIVQHPETNSTVSRGQCLDHGKGVPNSKQPCILVSGEPVHPKENNERNNGENMQIPLRSQFAPR